MRGIKEGASDFVVKPWDNDKLTEALQTALRARTLQDKRQAATSTAETSRMFWGDCEAMQQLRILTEKVRAIIRYQEPFIRKGESELAWGQPSLTTAEKSTSIDVPE